MKIEGYQAQPEAPNWSFLSATGTYWNLLKPQHNPTQQLYKSNDLINKFLNRQSNPSFCGSSDNIYFHYTWFIGLS
ncbi:hypothetical protein AFLA_005264 [Aspergillus flavus NRRL3357]|nr:hypothetical protein AFLA_005264 [Aspergillus flavus NRRL3357]